MLKHSLINKGVLNGNNKIMNEAALQPFHLAQPAEAGRSEVTAVKVTKAVCVEDER